MPITSASRASTTNQLNANDLKVGGVTAIEAALSLAPEAVISVRGDRRYVVMRAEQYDYLRECELESAWLATQADRASGNARTMTAAEHIVDMERRLLKAPAPAHMVQQKTAQYAVSAPTLKKKKAARVTAKKHKPKASA